MYPRFNHLFSVTRVVGLCAAMIGPASVLADGATRDLPDHYEPGSVLTVSIAIDPPEGTAVIGLEDAPPEGWTDIGNISDGGEYVSDIHKVRWFLMTEPFPDAVTYEITPPPDATGEACFDGKINFDGLDEYPVGGDECVDEYPPYNGACCNLDETCTENVPEAECVADDGRYLGDRLTCDGDPDEDGVIGCADVCPTVFAPAGVDNEGRPLGDLDHDCDVDLYDYAMMEDNFTGPLP